MPYISSPPQANISYANGSGAELGTDLLPETSCCSPHRLLPPLLPPPRGWSSLQWQLRRNSLFWWISAIPGQLVLFRGIQTSPTSLPNARTPVVPRADKPCLAATWPERRRSSSRLRGADEWQRQGPHLGFRCGRQHLGNSSSANACVQLLLTLMGLTHMHQGQTDPLWKQKHKLQLSTGRASLQVAVLPC